MFLSKTKRPLIDGQWRDTKRLGKQNVWHGSDAKKLVNMVVNMSAGCQQHGDGIISIFLIGNC